MNQLQVNKLFYIEQYQLWNSLPRAITTADSLHTFKKKLREFLFASFLVSEERNPLMFLSTITILTFRYFIQYFKLTL